MGAYAAEWLPFCQPARSIGVCARGKRNVPAARRLGVCEKRAGHAAPFLPRGLFEHGAVGKKCAAAIAGAAAAEWGAAVGVHFFT